MLSRYSSGAVPKAARHLRLEERLSLLKLILEWHLERGCLKAKSEKGIDLWDKELRREGKEKHLPGSRVQTLELLKNGRGVLGLRNYLYPKYAFFTCPKYKFIWFTDQNVYSRFHQLLTFLSSFSFFFSSWKLECWISCPFTCPLPPISAENAPSFIPQGTENSRNFHSFRLLGSGSGGRWWETSQAHGKNVSLDIPRTAGPTTPSPSRVPTKCVRPSEFVPWRVCSSSFIYSILYVIFHVISPSDLAESTRETWEGPAQALFLTSLPDLDTQG